MPKPPASHTAHDRGVIAGARASIAFMRERADDPDARLVNGRDALRSVAELIENTIRQAEARLAALDHTNENEEPT